MEAKLQSKIIKWLKEQGAYVIKTRPGPGTPVGCPDVIFLKGENWGAIEVKASAKAPFRVGQRETLDHLVKNNPHVYVANPGNWDFVRDRIYLRFFL